MLWYFGKCQSEKIVNDWVGLELLFLRNRQDPQDWRWKSWRRMIFFPLMIWVFSLLTSVFVSSSNLNFGCLEKICSWRIYTRKSTFQISCIKIKRIKNSPDIIIIFKNRNLIMCLYDILVLYHLEGIGITLWHRVIGLLVSFALVSSPYYLAPHAPAIWDYFLL